MVVLDIWYFQEIHNIAVKVSCPPSSSQFCVFVWDDATVWQDHISPGLAAVLFWLFGNTFLLAAMISRWVGDVDFSVCVLPNWPFLWQSLSVKAVRTSRVIQTERNKNHSWALSRQQVSRCEHSHIVWLTVPSTAWMRETSVTRLSLRIGMRGLPDLRDP